MSDKIYVGHGVEKFDGDMVSVSVCLTDLPKEHMFDYEGKKYIKLNVQKKKETDKYGKTHYLCVDTWKPKEEKKDDDELPF